jgi:predicted RNA binding protein YcfA (HicA-like mRNA interferase family)
MAKKSVTTRNLVKVLRDLGFLERRKKSGHLLMAHSQKGALVTIPTARSFVPIVHLQAIERSLESYGVISRDEFEDRLDIRMH